MRAASLVLLALLAEVGPPLLATAVNVSPATGTKRMCLACARSHRSARWYTGGRRYGRIWRICSKQYQKQTHNNNRKRLTTSLGAGSGLIGLVGFKLWHVLLAPGALAARDALTGGRVAWAGYRPDVQAMRMALHLLEPHCRQCRSDQFAFVGGAA